MNKSVSDITTPPDSPMLLSRSFVTRLLRVKRFKALTRAPPQARSKSLPPTASQKNAINYPKAFPAALRSTCQSSIADHCSMKASGVFEDNHKTINSKQKSVSTNHKSEVQLSKMLEYWLLPAFAAYDANLPK